ncbi:hypothetical protein BCV72DRAFT_247959 [Rhizopus microsporus var. microsporus]|uniref:MIP18 family-like domain-containing protein n=2 Tax=Rhizopus microsporus TaxID=58291 RepID=A0A2G4T1C7_RHIZD|nr:uncharacterized protein RHIMIDRAFT_287050 [Rhizopus microsporus ATCC 52813]ORE09795.1 hypothetical protein BCV72DRAFT_247959 [Rhizopus microsporus var. microsporus]PHZ14823.1 hypothetical protein RHIMIDRAFT_287050 [Rhizopus microsporus ATCC 52813]
MFIHGCTLEAIVNHINANPTIYKTKKIVRKEAEAEYDDNIGDPKQPLTLDQLSVAQFEHIEVDSENSTVLIEFTPTVPYCLMATLINFYIRARLLHVDIEIRKETYQYEGVVNKQLNDKERVAAVLENNHLLEAVNTFPSITYL